MNNKRFHPFSSKLELINSGVYAAPSDKKAKQHVSLIAQETRSN